MKTSVILRGLILGLAGALTMMPVYAADSGSASIPDNGASVTVTAISAGTDSTEGGQNSESQAKPDYKLQIDEGGHVIRPIPDEVWRKQ